MGAVDFSINPRLIEYLREYVPLDLFVETGTFTGDSVRSVLELFDEIHTIELSPDLYAAAVEQFADNANVNVHHGDSADVLGRLRPEMSGRSVLYWLDAHWCVADDTAGEQSQCPLLGELAAIEELNDSSVVLIDDARLFLCTPPHPHEVSQWPRFQQIVETLFTIGSAHEIAVVNDVIAFFPKATAPAVAAYAQAHAVDWLDVLGRLASLEQQREDLMRILDERLALIERLDRDLRERNN